MRTNIYICLAISFLVFQIFFSSRSQTVLTLQPGPAEGIDAPLLSIDPYSNFGNDPAFISCAWTFGGTFGIDRALMKFDLSQIPSSVIILSAKLSLYYWQGYATGHAGENASYLQKVLEDWNEMTVTWNNQPSVATTGGVFLPTSLTQSQDYPDIDITQFVSEWVADPWTNFGMLFRIADESVFRSMLFASSDNSDFSLRPKLIITYRSCPVPVAGFSYLSIAPAVHFSDSSSSASTWYWDFGDGYFSSLKNPVHTYGLPGKYYTCLSITDSCGSDQYCDTVYFCEPPNPRFSYVVKGNLVSFTDSSFSPLSWFWSFGDNFFSDLQNPTHYFQNAGIYYVCLTSGNICNQQTFCDSVVFQPNGVGTRNPEGLTIYPIPANDHLKIEWLNPDVGFWEIHIINSLGAVILRKGITITSVGYHDELDIQTLSPGYYYLKLIAKNGCLLRKFIVIKT